MMKMKMTKLVGVTVRDELDTVPPLESRVTFVKNNKNSVLPIHTNYIDMTRVVGKNLLDLPATIRSVTLSSGISTTVRCTSRLRYVKYTSSDHFFRPTVSKSELVLDGDTSGVDVVAYTCAVKSKPLNARVVKASAPRRVPDPEIFPLVEKLHVHSLRGDSPVKVSYPNLKSLYLTNSIMTKVVIDAPALEVLMLSRSDVTLASIPKNLKVVYAQNSSLDVKTTKPSRKVRLAYLWMSSLAGATMYDGIRKHFDADNVFVDIRGYVPEVVDFPGADVLLVAKSGEIRSVNAKSVKVRDVVRVTGDTSAVVRMESSPATDKLSRSCLRLFKWEV